MGFESGSISFRAFYVPEALPDDVISRFANLAAPSLEYLTEGEVHGWVTGRHLLDRNITEESALYAGYLRLTLMQAERKIPEPLFRAECAIEELAHLAATGAEYVSRKVKSEIKKTVRDRMLPGMPPHLKGIPMVYDQNEGLLYASCMSEKQFDAFVLNFKETTGIMPIPVVPKTAALKLRQVNTDDLAVVSFSPECDMDEVNDSVGQDFLTWLWFLSEARGGIVTFDHLGRFGVMIDGPLTFAMEGDGAHETVLRNGMPALSAEAKTSLLSGKKLKRAKLVLAREEEMWSVTLDADDFGFRSLKLPEGEKLDPISTFQQRVMALNLFTKVFLYLYDLFLSERSERDSWQKSQGEIHKWIEERHARK